MIPAWSFLLPFKVTSKANARGHTRGGLGRINAKQRAELTAAVGPDLRRLAAVDGGQEWLIHFTRIAPARLDDDNLRPAFKAYRDAVAALLGRDDRPGTGLHWGYSQRRGAPRSYAMELTLRLAPPTCRCCGQHLPLDAALKG